MWRSNGICIFCFGVGFTFFASLVYTNNINVTEHSIIQDHTLY